MNVIYNTVNILVVKNNSKWNLAEVSLLINFQNVPLDNLSARTTVNGYCATREIIVKGTFSREILLLWKSYLF